MTTDVPTKDLKDLLRRNGIPKAVLMGLQKKGVSGREFAGLKEKELIEIGAVDDHLRRKLERIQERMRKDMKGFINDAPPHLKKAADDLEKFYKANNVKEKIGKAQGIIDNFSDNPGLLVSEFQKKYPSKSKDIEFLRTLVKEHDSIAATRSTVGKKLDALYKKANSPDVGKGVHMVNCYSDAPKDLYSLVEPHYPTADLKFLADWAGVKQEDPKKKKKAEEQRKKAEEEERERKEEEEQRRRQEEEEERIRKEEQEAERKRKEEEAERRRKEEEEEKRRKEAEKEEEDRRRREEEDAEKQRKAEREEEERWWAEEQERIKAFETERREEADRRWKEEREAEQRRISEMHSKREALREEERQRRAKEALQRAEWEQPLIEARTRVAEMERILAEHERREDDQIQFIKELYLEQDSLRSRLSKKKKKSVNKATQYSRDESGSPSMGMQRVLGLQQVTMRNIERHIQEEEEEIAWLQEEVRKAEEELVRNERIAEGNKERLRSVQRAREDELLGGSLSPSTCATCTASSREKQKKKKKRQPSPYPQVIYISTPPPMQTPRPFVNPSPAPSSACTCNGSRRAKTSPFIDTPPPLVVL